jgi:phospholipid/cholesterol/gamma-HCH transport system substrate-binding protein
MKKQKGNIVVLGIFITVGIALFVFGIYKVGNRQQLFNQSFRISCLFKDVGGLQAGNNVRFGGINVGTVENIQIINDSSMRVDALIDAQTKKFIKKDATANIGSEGLMGNKILIISHGDSSSAEIEDNDFISSSVPISIDDIMVRLEISTENVAYITDDILAITKNIREGKGTIGSLFMDSVLAKNLTQSIQNIKEGSSGLKSNIESARRNFFLRWFFKKKSEEEKNDPKNSKKKKNEK